VSPRASRWEIAGAWLHVWTPPRGVEVPDPPWRRIGVIALIVLAVLGGAAAAVKPGIDRGKQRTSRREAREQAAYVRAEFARLEHDQRLVRGRARLDGSAPVAEREAQLTEAIGAAVAAEARRRHASGELESVIVAGSASCRRRDSSTAQRLRLECLTPTSYVDRGDGKRAGSIGYPFLAGGSLRTGRFAFCKTNPPPGEKFAQFGNREPPQLPAACAH
jgi:type II secretory pathway pseudopilin PulG